MSTTAPPPLADRLLARDPRAIARAISLIENESPQGAALVGRIYGHTGRAYVIGVTGPPGAGKSTLVERLTAELRRGGATVGILAVDPTSPYSGGAILGDRVRMQSHAEDDGVFIRSMATRGHLGGLARTTTEAALVLDAAGFDYVVIETVGVGQDEIDIVRTADVSIVTVVPGTGDEVQALKAGIMEIADIFVVNQSDREGADLLVQAIAANQALRPVEPGEWRPPILKTTATAGEGIAELWSAIQRFLDHSAGAAASRRRIRQAHGLRQLLSQRLLEQLERALPEGELERTVDRITAREIDPYSAVAELINRGKGTSHPGSPIQEHR